MQGWVSLEGKPAWKMPDWIPDGLSGYMLCANLDRGKDVNALMTKLPVIYYKQLWPNEFRYLHTFRPIDVKLSYMWSCDTFVYFTLADLLSR